MIPKPRRLNTTQATVYVGYKDARTFKRWASRKAIKPQHDGHVVMWLVDDLDRGMRVKEVTK